MLKDRTDAAERLSSDRWAGSGERGWNAFGRLSLATAVNGSADDAMLVDYREAPAPLLSDSAAGLPVVAASPSSSEPALLRVVNIGGVELHAVTEQQTIDLILSALSQGFGGTVVTPNLDIVRNCRRDLSFATLVAESSLAIADGTPLIWASKVQGTLLPQRVAGSDLISTLSAAAATAGRSIFLLGGAPGAAEGAAEVLKSRSPTLKVAGTYCPPMGFEKNPEELRKIEQILTAARPDIVWVALGSPKQERLIAILRKTLPAAWWLGVGISFSFLTGEVQRAPKVLQKVGLEWLHRVWQEPGRLAKRYFVHGLPFFATLMAESAWRRVNGRSKEMVSTKPLRARRPRRHHNGNPAFNDSVVGMQYVRPAPQKRVPNPIPRAVRFGPHERGLKRLKAVILLGGKVRQSSLSASIGRSVLDLPIDNQSSILNNWVNQCNELAKRVGLENLTVRVMVDQKAHEPTSIPPGLAHMVKVERDRSSFRGTGGLVADIAKDYDDEDLILVASASQILLDPLAAIAQALDHKTGEFTLISHRDGTAGGIMLLKCKTVRGVSDVGFIDLKEQALPSIAKHHDVRVVHCRQPTGVPLFSLNDYIGALQQFHRRRLGRRARTNPLGEEFNRLFAIVEPGAIVAKDAYLHDAVVLRGATVESEAAAIRSLILPGAIVERGRHISDRLVIAE